MKKIFAVCMIVIGSFLEIYFYVWRFNQDGLPLYLSIIIGTGLTMLLTMCVYQRKYKAATFIIIPLALYSVFATSAGQAFSLNDKAEVEEQKAIDNEYLTQNIEMTEKEIEEINLEIKTLQNAIGITVSGLEDAWEYKGTLERSQKRIDELRTYKENLLVELKQMREKATAHTSVKVRPKNIYTFYADMLKFNEYWLQFILQTLLSAFIAIMSPAGLILFNTDEKEKPKRKYTKRQVEKQIEITPDEIQEWVDIGWFGVKSGKSEKLVPEKTFSEYLQKHQKQFDKQKYDEMLKTSQGLHLVDKSRIIKEKREAVAVRKMIKQFTGKDMVQWYLFEREAE